MVASVEAILLSTFVLIARDIAPAQGSRQDQGGVALIEGLAGYARLARQPQVQTAPIGVRVQQGPKLPPL